VCARSWPPMRDTLRGMQDKDPRPMPIEVQSAYREPIDLLGLLETDVYSPADRIAVRDSLLSSLLATYGDAWVELGSKEVRVTTRVKAFRKNIVAGVELLLDVPDYRGREETLPLLAQAMEPRWAQWWNTFDWTTSSRAIFDWTKPTQRVLGLRQFAWLAAQYARTVIDLVQSDSRPNSPRLRSACLRAIQHTERWSRQPSKLHEDEAIQAGKGALSLMPYDSPDAANAVDAAAYATRVVGYAQYEEAAVEQFQEACSSAVLTGAKTTKELAELTRQLITPTLVTGAVRGARTNPQSKASAKVARLEREVRSAADGRALSISGLHVGRALLMRMSPPLRGAEWVIVSHIRVHGEDEFAFFISDRAGTWPKRMLELYMARKVSDFKQALAQIDYELVGG
jgi:hypothetical protein